MPTDSTPQFLRIRDWNTRFENNRTRELKYLDWVPISNRMDTDGYIELVDHPDGAAHAFVWVACVMIASRCENPALRGVLVRDDGTPHTAASIARQSRIPAPLCGIALKRLQEMTWLETVSPTKLGVSSTSRTHAGISHHGAIKTQGGATTRARAERNGTERNIHTTPPIPPSTEGGRTSGNRLTREQRKQQESIQEIERHTKGARH
jgi:hypothetical protein